MNYSHLESIYLKQNRIANLQVVFVDIEKYSQRRTSTQIEVIDNFTKCLKEAVNTLSVSYQEYADENNIDFENDVILIPTGDGAIIVFSFDGLNDLHLNFSKELLRVINHVNMRSKCQKFEENGWCNCHDSFNLKIAISEGKGIIYKDINENYNVAGNVINIASRLLGLADGNQIMFTEEAYKQIVDMVLDPDLIDHFIEFKDIEIKHGSRINAYQYIDLNSPHINSHPSKSLTLNEKALMFAKKLGFSMPDLKAVGQLDTEKLILTLETLINSESFTSSKSSKKEKLKNPIDISE